MQNADVVQRKMFTIRFSDEESERLALVAKHYALTSAGVLRMLVKREADAIGTAAPAARQPAPKSRSKR
jgi:hypothetical protein